MAVDPDDDLTGRGADGGVEPVGGAAGRVGHQANPRIGRGDVGRHLVGAVARGPEREHDLERARVVLARGSWRRRRAGAAPR